MPTETQPNETQPTETRPNEPQPSATSAESRPEIIVSMPTIYSVRKLFIKSQKEPFNLVVNCSDVTAEGLRFLVPLTNLRGLSLWQCKRLKPDVVEILAQMPQLEELRIIGCRHLRNSIESVRQALPQCVVKTKKPVAWTDRLTTRTAHFTLVELAVVVSIIGMLIVLLLPAVSASRPGSWRPGGQKPGELTDEALAAWVAKHPDTRYLNLDRATGITDAGLACLKSLSKLKDLRIGQCSGITDAGLAHLTEIPELRSLSLEGNPQFTGTGMAHVGKIKKLAVLNLGSCTGITPQGLLPLAEVKTLQWNSIIIPDHLVKPETLEVLGHFRYMTRIVIRTDVWSVTDETLMALRGMKGLEEFELRARSGYGPFPDKTRGGITDAGLAFLKELPNLKHVTIAGQEATGRCFEALADMPECRLESITIDNCPLDVKGIRAIGRLSGLRMLGLERCSTLNDAVFRPLANLKALNGLTLVDVPLGDAAFDTIGRLESLVVLTVSMKRSQDRMTGRNLGALKDLKALTSVTLRFPVGDRGALELSRLRTLKRVILSGRDDHTTRSGITDLGAACFAKMPELTELELNAALLTDTGLNQLSNCAKLQWLDVSESRLLTRQGVLRFKKKRPECHIFFARSWEK